MGTVKVHDRADEFRIEIVGRFAGESVHEIAVTWKKALRGGWRRFTVDISRLSSYDAAGRKLLNEMYLHGMQIAAGTPLSLVFLNEISGPRHRGPMLLPEAPGRRRLGETQTVSTSSLRPLAAGE